MEAILNRHNRDFGCCFTIEFDVKCYLNLPKHLHKRYEYEYQDGHYINMYAEKWYKKIMKSKYKFIKDWSFAGRSNGWIVLICEGDENKIKGKTLERMSKITEKYLNKYEKYITACLEYEYEHQND